ncbi:L-serine ammonia-lyase [Nitrincola schmidtii]|uniref:L-serine ammonia-lyase n=1 Tax=Nitrincola schmidtii TaxID=1730894 RepID=UPI00124BDAE8|nr:L-serine ammonia-lyase [Nitrincola schmidtii]
MSISVFDLFKIGVGPSSSHTVGPMSAACDFATVLDARNLLNSVKRIEVRLYGSLSATGKGHATDKAIIMGLMGERPDRIDPSVINARVEELISTETLFLYQHKHIPFIWDRDMVFLEEVLPRHPNAMSITAYDDEKALYQNTYYSIGGGFVITDEEAQDDKLVLHTSSLPYEFNTAEELLRLCKEHQMSISELMLENEKVWRSEADIRSGLWKIWEAMHECVENGLKHGGILPGGLNVRRRAPDFFQRLKAVEQNPNVISTTFSVMDWVNVYALAVNEENAAGGRMVTAPTNGAAGIIPAVLCYYVKFEPTSCEKQVVDFLLAAGAVGILCKKNASISGAEVGCQGEVGSACAMAAAGLCQVLGGTPSQVENAAEIGLEHNLGLTCDPVGGLVQVPCIERNAIASIKAINAAQMALRGDGEHFISLDKVIRTMRDTGRDMQDKYKETSRGGLAVNAIEC